MEFLRKNWAMVGVLCLCLCALAAGVVSLLAGGGAKPGPAKHLRTLRPVSSQERERAREILYKARDGASLPTEREKRLAYVEKYRKQLEETPEAPETPVTLHALGQVYKQLQDFPNAEWAFSELIRRFPDSKQCVSAWLELGTCYEFTGDQEKMISTYMDMAKAFPADTEAHKFAQSKLKLLDVPVPGPVAEPAAEPAPEGFVQDVEFESKSPVAGAAAPAETPAEQAAAETVGEEGAAAPETPAPETAEPAQ